MKQPVTGAAAVLFIAAPPEMAAFKPKRAGGHELCDLLIEARYTGVDKKIEACQSG